MLYSCCVPENKDKHFVKHGISVRKQCVKHVPTIQEQEKAVARRLIQPKEARKGVVAKKRADRCFILV